MTVTVQDVSVIQKRVVFKNGFLEYSKNEEGQVVRNSSGTVLFSSRQDDALNNDFSEAASALSALSKIISSNNKKVLGKTSPLKGRKSGPRRSKENPLATPVQ